MAEFPPAFERMIINEGGYVLHTVKGDRGGMTYAGVSRKNWTEWDGWAFIDSGDDVPAHVVREFYKLNFWDRLHADHLRSQDVAQSLFDFAVNAGTKMAVRLAQAVAGTTPDGVIGQKTLSAINAMNSELFIARYALAKVARYAAIVTKDRSQSRFLLGWLNRTLRESRT